MEETRSSPSSSSSSDTKQLTPAAANSSSGIYRRRRHVTSPSPEPAHRGEDNRIARFFDYPMMQRSKFCLGTFLWLTTIGVIPLNFWMTLNPIYFKMLFANSASAAVIIGFLTHFPQMFDDWLKGKPEDTKRANWVSKLLYSNKTRHLFENPIMNALLNIIRLTGTLTAGAVLGHYYVAGNIANIASNVLFLPAVGGATVLVSAHEMGKSLLKRRRQRLSRFHLLENGLPSREEQGRTDHPTYRTVAAIIDGLQTGVRGVLIDRGPMLLSVFWLAYLFSYLSVSQDSDPEQAIENQHAFFNELFWVVFCLLMTHYVGEYGPWVTRKQAESRVEEVPVDDTSSASSGSSSNNEDDVSPLLPPGPFGQAFSPANVRRGGGGM